MTDQPLTDQPLTEEEASAFSDKLDAFSETLTEREQAILNGLLAAANAATASQTDEVAGFAYDAFLKIDGIEGEAVGRFRTRDLSQTALAPMTGSTQFKVKYS